MVLIMLWLLITLRPLLQCMMCVATHMHVRGHTPRGWSRPVVVGCQSSPVTLMPGSGHHSRTDGRPLVSAAVITVNSDYTRSVERLTVNSHGVAQKTVWIIVSMNRGVKWSSLVGVRGSELSDDIYRARSRQLANADQYCDGNHRLWRHR